MRGIRIALITLLAALFMSCSLLVDPENADVRCVAQSGATDPCGAVEAGSVCRGGKCQRCEPGVIQEDCNLVDDDCDGKIDEGNDQDGDGFTWCGGGVRALADCVDTDATIRPAGDSLDGAPGHRDICGDGIDNDCSGVPDDAPDCDLTTECEDADTPCATSGTCVTCPAPQECQPCDADRCGVRRSICVAPLKPGSACTSDADCEDGVCVTGAALGLTGDVGKVCSRACCGDTDCGIDNVCVVRGNGTRLCAPPGLVGRATKREGDTCGDDDECASGVCDPTTDGGEATCRRACTTDLDCVGAPHGGACIFAPRSSLTRPGAFVCGEAAADGLTFGQVCVPNASACASGLCVPSPIYLGACNQSCRTTCPVEGSVCAYEATSPLLPQVRSPLCVLTEGTAILGESCQDSSDCGQGRCVEGRCSQACCNDDDCVASRCRPILRAVGYGMYCAAANLQ